SIPMASSFVLAVGRPAVPSQRLPCGAGLGPFHSISFASDPPGSAAPPALPLLPGGSPHRGCCLGQRRLGPATPAEIPHPPNTIPSRHDGIPPPTPTS